jgi:tRNA-specific 2-thiouridylase
MPELDLNLPDGAKVGVAMSGGVDSSVAAALLAEQGYQVFGMMLRLWTEPGSEAANRCCTPDAMARARQIAGQLGIPFYVVDAKDIFRDTVVDYFLDGYARGVTPNPCLVCNRHIRWEFLLNRALALEANFMATGHYARVRREDGQPVRLLRGVDAGKDQSYVLSVLNQEQLARAVFPIGELTKPEVRAMAARHGLPAASVADSQDLCFLAGTDYRSFLGRHAPETNAPGPIVDPHGEELGRHEGLAMYTIGQRKGLGINSAQPMYVLRKETASNTLVVGPAESLGSTELQAENANWVSGKPEREPFRAEVKIRYTAGFQPGTVTPGDEGQFTVQFDQPLRDITPGQAAVAYRDEEAVVCGIITPGDKPVEKFKPIRLIK